MKINIGIIDDNLHDIAYLMDGINSWAEQSGCEAEVCSFASPEYVLSSAEGELEKLDIVFVDVLMPDENGLNLIVRLRERVGKPLLYVLVSSNTGYVHDGYSVEAFDFIAKPVERKKLFSVLDRAVKKLFINNAGAIHYEYGKIMYKINYSDICFIFVNGNYANVVTVQDEVQTFRHSLKKLLDTLPQNFVQVNRNTIVNVMQISTISNEEIAFVRTGRTVKPSRMFMNELVTAFKRCN